MKAALLAAAAVLALSSAPGFAQEPNDRAATLRQGEALSNGRHMRHARDSQNTPMYKHRYEHARSERMDHRESERMDGRESRYTRSGADNSAEELNARQLQPR